MMENWKAKLEKRVNQSFDKAIDKKGFLSLQSIVESQFEYHGKRKDLLNLKQRENRLTITMKRNKVIMIPALLIKSGSMQI